MKKNTKILLAFAMTISFLLMNWIMDIADVAASIQSCLYNGSVFFVICEPVFVYHMAWYTQILLAIWGFGWLITEIGEE